ncbi:MAG: alpha/beta fold hydrolase [Candidatus Rokuibacteriota bacterium]
MTRGELLARGPGLYHERHGPAGAPPLVLLHGLGSSAADWRWQVAAFSDRYAVITVDLRAHGRSSLSGATLAHGRLSVEAMATEVDGLLTRLGEGPAHVVGLSLGGCVALALALGAPTRVRSLTLVNTFARLRPAGWRGGWRMLERVVLLAVVPMPVIAARIARNLFPKPEQADLRAAAEASLGRNDKRAYLAAVRALARFDARRRLGEIRCPTLLVAGERDTTVPRASLDLLRRRIPHAQVRVVADSGHATPYDQPRLFNGLLLEFVTAH